MPNILVPTPLGQMPAWLAIPIDSTQVPGVVVLHDVAGMSQDHRNQADWLAEAGFLALAIDLYYRGGFPLCLRAIIRDFTARSGPTFDDVEAARTWLLAHPKCNGKVGVIGFCMGGGLPSGPMTARPAIQAICKRDRVPFTPQPKQNLRPDSTSGSVPGREGPFTREQLVLLPILLDARNLHSEQACEAGNAQPGRGSSVLAQENPGREREPPQSAPPTREAGAGYSRAIGDRPH